VGVTCGPDQPAVHQLLESARVRTGLSVEELWTECVALGANASIDELEAILNGTRSPSAREYDFIAHSLNERMVELGFDDPVPYAEDVGL
jgi:hypothetical protein